MGRLFGAIMGGAHRIHSLSVELVVMVMGILYGTGHVALTLHAANNDV